MLAKTVRSRTEGWDAANTAKTITLSQDEINAWYDIHDNTDTAALVERVNPFLRDLRITFIDGAIVISGKPKDSDTVDSLVLKPHVDEQGNLDLRLTDVLVGTLSVPRVFMGKTFAQLQSDLTAHVAAQQSRAGIDAYGAVNRAAMTAAYAQMLLNCLAGQPSEAIFFVPFDFKDSSKALAVRLAAITADDGKMTFTLRALTPEERLALTQKINHAAAPATVGPATP